MIIKVIHKLNVFDKRDKNKAIRLLLKLGKRGLITFSSSTILRSYISGGFSWSHNTAFWNRFNDKYVIALDERELTRKTYKEFILSSSITIESVDRNNSVRYVLASPITTNHPNHPIDSDFLDDF
jgi:hypothetical protein